MAGCKCPVLGLDGSWISNFYKPLPDSLCWKNDQILFWVCLVGWFLGFFVWIFFFFPFESVPALAQVSSVSLPVSLPVRWRTSCPFLIF